eukprot:4312043-Alexandrium_andersonii.AAC.1
MPAEASIKATKGLPPALRKAHCYRPEWEKNTCQCVRVGRAGKTRPKQATLRKCAVSPERVCTSDGRTEGRRQGWDTTCKR